MPADVGHADEGSRAASHEAARYQGRVARRGDRTTTRAPRRAHLVLGTQAPFRLDLTVLVLQRLFGNPIDVWERGRWVRAFETPDGPVACEVTQVARRPEIRAVLTGPAGDLAPWRDRLRRMLGLDVDLAPFHARARRLPALAPLERRIRGVRPPRFAALHEAFAAVIPFQQVSLASGIAMLRRLAASLAPPVVVSGTTVYPFPDATRLAGASDAVLRAAGFSAAKALALRSAARAIADGSLRDAELAALPSGALVERLTELPGIGPWSASLLALRYFGRLDVFPPGDAAAVKALVEVGRGEDLLERLGPWRGMLYYCLFLRRILGA